MKVLLINGSPRAKGNTARALREMAEVFERQGVEAETIQVGNQAIRGCVACGRCGTLGRCVFDDAVNEVAPKFEAADGIVVGSPVYYAGPNATVTAFLDRLFYSARFSKAMKVGASVAVCRRGGASAAFDRLNKYYTIQNMPIVSSQYWNMVYGQTPGQAEQDEEGMQTMRTLAHNMAWMLRKLNGGDEGQPEMKEQRVWTNFIR